MKAWLARACWGSIAAAALLTAAAGAAGGLAGPRGLRLSATARAADPASPPRRVAAVDLRDLRMDPHLPHGAGHARWDGFWRIPETGRYKLVAKGGGTIVVKVAGQPVVSGQRDGRQRGLLDLAAGLHALQVDYTLPDGPDRLRLRWSRAGDPPREFEPGSLFAAVPSRAQLAWARAASVLRVTAGIAWMAALLTGAAIAWRAERGGRLWRGLRIALPAAVVLYGAALRFETLVARYAWEGPRWALAAQRVIERWHPATLRFEPEAEVTGGDPYNYVHRARALRGFYDADAREPLFPALTRALLRALDDRILAVHVASALASTLVVLATGLLGAAAFSRAVGVGAALVMAVDRDVLWWSAEGFRDDTFTLFVVLGAWALWRLHERPTVLRAVLAGLLGGAACLTRITALSFLLPALVWLLLARGQQARERRQAVGVCALTVFAFVGPFLLSCAIAFGDPFHAVNFHTQFYRSRSGMEFRQTMGWVDYLRQASPLVQQLETGLQGLTTYPFGNKWRGLEYLSSWLARGLSVAGLAGLLLFLASPAGRLLLIVLFSSLLPYAFTWTIPGGAEWRFTMHAYPFYLIAAALALSRAVRIRRGSA